MKAPVFITLFLGLSTLAHASERLVLKCDTANLNIGISRIEVYEVDGGSVRVKEYDTRGAESRDLPQSNLRWITPQHLVSISVDHYVMSTLDNQIVGYEHTGKMVYGWVVSLWEDYDLSPKTQEVQCQEFALKN